MILKFLKFCDSKNFAFEELLERVQTTRIVQLVFLNNLLRAGIAYIEIHKEKRAKRSIYIELSEILQLL